MVCRTLDPVHVPSLNTGRMLLELQRLQSFQMAKSKCFGYCLCWLKITVCVLLRGAFPRSCVRAVFAFVYILLSLTHIGGLKYEGQSGMKANIKDCEPKSHGA
jgi:hypothetical protein